MLQSSIRIKDSRLLKTVVAGIIFYMVAPLGMTMLPLLVGAVTTELGFSDSEAGFLASVDLFGIVLAAVTSPFWVHRFSRKRIALLCVTLLLAGNIWSLNATGFIELCSARFIAEIGSGIAFSISLVTLGEREKPDRYFSIGIGSTIALAVVVFLWLPAIIQQQGITIIFIVQILLAALVGIFIGWTPAYGEKRSEAHAHAGRKKGYTRLFLCFIGFSCFTIVEGGVWSYVERIGDFSGLSAEYVGEVLALTQVVSLIASIASSTLSTRYGRFVPLAFGGLVFLISLYLIQQPQPELYLLGGCMSQFAYIFMLPYLMLLCVELDPSGRYYVLITAFKMGGFAVGPAIVATMLDGSGFVVVSWIGVLFLCLSQLLVIPLALRLDRVKTGHIVSSPGTTGLETGEMK